MYFIRLFRVPPYLTEGRVLSIISNPLGHLARECKPSAPVRAVAPVGYVVDTCYRCGGTGHIARSCPSDDRECYQVR